MGKTKVYKKKIFNYYVYYLILLLLFINNYDNLLF